MLRFQFVILILDTHYPQVLQTEDPQRDPAIIMVFKQQPFQVGRNKHMREKSKKLLEIWK